MNPALELGPILRSMRHHKGTFSLLVLEVALGFVMLTHTLITGALLLPPARPARPGCPRTSW